MITQELKQQLIDEACNGDESARIQLQEEGVWETPLCSTRLCTCGSGLSWVSCPGILALGGEPDTRYCG